MKKCVNENCDYFKAYKECVPACLANGIKKNITNGDYIRSMSDAELSVFINGNCTCDCCTGDGTCIEAFNMSKCIAGVTEWLGQERKVENGKEKEERAGTAKAGTNEKGGA